MDNTQTISSIQDTKPAVDFSKIRIGLQMIEDATINLSSYKKIDSTFADKTFILNAINNGNLSRLQDISNFYLKVSGIYKKLCKHAANFYKYDWFLDSYIESDKATKENAIKLFNKNLKFLDNFNVKKYLSETAYKVVTEGCYYGYIIYTPDGAQIQELPSRYCRSRFKIMGRPVVEFQMRFFVDYYKDIETRKKILNLFPKEFRKGYLAFEEGKLPPQFVGDTSGWCALDPDCAFKFSADENDFPMFITTIPHLIDLDEAQALDKKKMTQEIIKILIQKMPLDKNNELVFDLDEIQELHNNAVAMIGGAIGVNILSTPADVTVADMSGSASRVSEDQLEKVERGVYNDAGTAQNLFNPDGNLALEKSVINDEASLWSLVLQFQEFLNMLIKPLNSNKKITFRVQILPTTFYNYKELSKMYKEQVQLGGCSRVFPQLALGQSQSSIIAAAVFEKDYLDLYNLFIAPISSNNMNAQALEKQGAGRTEKPDDQKSEKTIQNRESMS